MYVVRQGRTKNIHCITSDSLSDLVFRAGDPQQGVSLDAHERATDSLASEVEVSLRIVVNHEVLQDGGRLKYWEVVSVRVDDCGDAA